MPEAGASTAIVETRASGVARPIAIAVNTRYPTCVYTGAPTAVTGVQNLGLCSAYRVYANGQGIQENRLDM